MKTEDDLNTDPVDAECQDGGHHGYLPAAVDPVPAPVLSPGGPGPHHHHQAPGVEGQQGEDHQPAGDLDQGDLSD